MERRQIVKRVIIRILILVAILAVIAGAAEQFLTKSKAPAVKYRTTKITRDDLVSSISATGTVEPQEVIDVGAQVAGQILSFGKDANGKTIDYGSTVEEGMILAQIDDSLYSADLASATAQVESAKAALQRDQADLVQLKARLDQAQRDWDRAQKIGPSEALAQSSYDSYQSAFEIAKANVAVGEAAILVSKASQLQAEAVLQRAKRNLGYCTIKSPVRGVVIDRRVNIGQTVVASLNAPSLFLLAQDLTRMQVWVIVNEVDIGKISPGQLTRFTVDAFPGETFFGQVGKVRWNASMTQNVVTYTVEVITDNSKGKLLPYLTANVQFELVRRPAVLQVVNAALRWSPPMDKISPEFMVKVPNKPAPGNANRPRQAGSPPMGSAEPKSNDGVLWVMDQQQFRPIRVRTGLSDGLMTEVEGEGITEGLEVVIGQETVSTSASDTTNPFAPRIRPTRPSGSGSTGGTGRPGPAGGRP
jgi:HlyD family secretion protein